MFSKLGAKIALRKAGIPSNAFSYESKPSKPSDPNKQNELLPFANPLANLSVPKSWQSWATPVPPPVEVAATPVIGTRAPNSMKLRLPTGDGRPAIVVFLRHCGCPCMSPHRQRCAMLICEKSQKKPSSKLDDLPTNTPASNLSPYHIARNKQLINGYLH
jgi:hypothetical protein